MITPYKANSITLKLYEIDGACAVTATMDPPMTEEDSLKGNTQPHVTVAYAILAALVEQAEEGSSQVPMSGTLQ